MQRLFWYRSCHWRLARDGVTHLRTNTKSLFIMPKTRARNGFEISQWRTHLRTEMLKTWFWNEDRVNGNITTYKPYTYTPISLTLTVLSLICAPALISAPPPFFCFPSSFVSFPRGLFFAKNRQFLFCVCIFFAFPLSHLNFNHIFHCFSLMCSWYSGNLTF